MSCVFNLSPMSPGEGARARRARSCCLKELDEVKAIMKIYGAVHEKRNLNICDWRLSTNV